MAAPDLDLGRRFLAANPPPGEALLVAVTGSHQYGFDSPDSDLDLKGVHLAPTAALLGLRAPPDAFDRLEIFEGTECDLTTHEAGRACVLLLDGNGNLLERLTSPYQLLPGPDLDALRALIPAALSQACYRHYAGFFGGCRREHLKRPRAKSWLYSVRAALSGVHLLRTGEVEAHLPTLADRYGYGGLVHPVVDAKRSGREKDGLDPERSAELEACWPALEAALVDARAQSVLPEAPPDPSAVERWLIERRLRAVR